MSPKTLSALREAIAQAIALDIADPHEIAEATVGTLPRSLKTQVLLHGWANLLRGAMRNERRTIDVENIDRVRVYVEDVDGRWTHLRDMTVDEVLSVASRYRQRAQDNLDEADRYERLAKIMANIGAAMVSDVPQSMLEEVFGPELPAELKAAA